jgi:DNA-binding transcriptional regulator YiaG
MGTIRRAGPRTGQARKSRESVAGQEPSRAELIRQVRRGFGVTQTQLAAAMGTSAKAIQSYEQGWRNVPTRVLMQLFVLLAVHRRRQVDKVPCWEIMNCPPKAREECPSYTIGDGQFCWLMAGASGRCQWRPAAPATGSPKDVLPCSSCEVIRRLLRATPVTPAGHAPVAAPAV